MKFKEFAAEEAAGVGKITKQNTTADVKPGETARQAAKFGNRIGKDGRPPELHKKARKNSNAHVLTNLGLGESRQLNELFDAPYSWSWTRLDDSEWQAEAHTDEGEQIKMKFINVGNGRFFIDFYRNGTQNVTGSGDAFKIFATVFSALHELIKEKSPKSIAFIAEKNPQSSKNQLSRINLYKRMVKRFAGQQGYQADMRDTSTSTKFVLVNKERVIDLDEVKINNVDGRGAVPVNQEIDYFGMRTQMRPSMFLKLAAPLAGKPKDEMVDYIRQGGAIGAPFLIIDVPEDLKKDIPRVVGHEGRNRMKAVVAAEGDDPIEVHLFFRGAVSRARHLTKEIVDLLKAGAYQERTGRHVPGPLWEGKYPLADYDTWYGDRQYHEQGAKMVMMTPDKYLARVRPLTLDDESIENIDDLANHIQSGRKLDPLKIYPDGKEDGRHRAYAAKKLGIKKVPVIVWPQKKTESEIKKPHPSQTLGIKRQDMPQIHKDHYPELIKYLESHGGKFRHHQMPAQDLKPVQSEFSDKGVRQMMTRGDDHGGTTRKKPLIVSSDKYIVDGHHRWLAAWNLDETIPVMQISFPIRKLFQLVKDFKYTTYKDIHEKYSKIEIAVMEGGHNLDDLNEIRLSKNLNNDDAMMEHMPAILQSVQDGGWNKIDSKNNFDIWIQKDFDHQGGRVVLTDRDITVLISSLLLKGELYGAQVVGMSWSHPRYRRKGYNSMLYQALLDRGYNIRSDSAQTRGSQAVWKSLYPKYQTFLYRQGQKIGQVRDDDDFKKAYRRSSQSDGYYLVVQSPSGKTMENMSVAGTERQKSERKKKLVPGSEAWFQHWFSLPYLKREQFEQLKHEAVEHVRRTRHEKATNRRSNNRNTRTNERRGA